MKNKYNIFSFGEQVEGFDVKVLNEREVRAAAGILFLFAFISFMTAFLRADFYLTKLFVTLFLLDFAIRIFINPKFSPSLIIARAIVSGQAPEYVGAAQKRFAWSIGFGLALVLFSALVLFNSFSPLNAFVCIICLLLLFFEAVFGICLGCKLYHLFAKDETKYCPGNSCATTEKSKIQKISSSQTASLLLVFMFVFALVYSGIISDNKNSIARQQSQEHGSAEEEMTSQNQDCVAPEWAVKIGHEQIWKEHNGCK